MGEAFARVRGGVGGVLGANMIGMSAVSSAVASSRAGLLRGGGEFWLLLLLLDFSRGAKASSQVPEVSSTLVSWRVCSVGECWIARARRLEALVWAFVIERVVIWGKWRVRFVREGWCWGLRCWCWAGLLCCDGEDEVGFLNGRGPLAPSQVKFRVCRVGWKMERYEARSLLESFCCSACGDREGGVVGTETERCLILAHRFADAGVAPQLDRGEREKRPAG